MISIVSEKVIPNHVRMQKDINQLNERFNDMNRCCFSLCDELVQYITELECRLEKMESFFECQEKAASWY